MDNYKNFLESIRHIPPRHWDTGVNMVKVRFRNDPCILLMLSYVPYSEGTFLLESLRTISLYWFLGSLIMTTEIALVLCVLAVTIIFFITELFRVDVTAIIIMLALPWLGLVKPLEAFSGLASNGVISILPKWSQRHGKAGRRGKCLATGKFCFSVRRCCSHDLSTLGQGG